MSKEKLKPCPFCGSEAFLRQTPAFEFNEFDFYVSCSNCRAMIDNIYGTEERAIEAWNRRAR